MRAAAKKSEEKKARMLIEEERKARGLLGLVEKGIKTVQSFVAESRLKKAAGSKIISAYSRAITGLEKIYASSGDPEVRKTAGSAVAELKKFYEISIFEIETVYSSNMDISDKEKFYKEILDAALQHISRITSSARTEIMHIKKL